MRTKQIPRRWNGYPNMARTDTKPVAADKPTTGKRVPHKARYTATGKLPPKAKSTTTGKPPSPSKPTTSRPAKCYGTRTATGTIIPPPLTAAQLAAHRQILATHERLGGASYRNEVNGQTVKARKRKKHQMRVQDKIKYGAVEVIEITDDMGEVEVIEILDD
ncbi:hypothetical protein EDC01DRAFT_786225 [Geopyxis carbonaria]|nr:hypothetical protein EDC01DRAFT_786225 [Geopyxis carbonaria]